MASSTKPKPRTWIRDGYLISTDPSLIPLSALNAAFDSRLLHWASALPEAELQVMLDNSLSFGLYSPTSSLPPSGTDPEDSFIAGGSEAAADAMHEIASHVKPHGESGKQSLRPSAPSRAESTSPMLIGFARLITDFVTFSYLTDVYVLPQWQGQKLGQWLIECVQETLESMPHLRRSMAITGGGERSMISWYEKMMKMKPVPMDAGRKYTVIESKGRGNVF